MALPRSAHQMSTQWKIPTTLESDIFVSHAIQMARQEIGV